MSEMMTVNVAFKLRVPVDRDQCGRRVCPTQTVARYLDDYFSDVRINQNFVHESEKRGSPLPQVAWNYPEKLRTTPQSQYNQVVGSIRHFFQDEYARLLRLKRIEDAEIERRKKFDEVSEKGCQELFKMSWKDFQKLSWPDKGRLKSEANVEFDSWNGGFVRNVKVKVPAC